MTRGDVPHPALTEGPLGELLAEDALWWLSPEGEAELARALAAAGPAVDSTCLRAIVAELELACAGREPEPLPAAARERVAALLAAHARAAGGLERGRPGARPWALGAALGAAGGALAVLAACHLARPREASSPAPAPSLPPPGQLALTAPDALRLPWSATEDPAAAGATGEVTWSPAAQAGVMTFRGLAPNDAGAAQYQLWIFDAARDERFPVDGGVFDVPAGAAEVTVAIRAAVPVHEATLFAVTVERPGGVVVSSRERIVLVARRG